MNLAEFDNTHFTPDMWVNYQGRKYYMASIDSIEKLFGLSDSKEDTDRDTWYWVRCESAELINDKGNNHE